VKYVNFLNEGKNGTPIFGSELASGSGTLGKLILGSVNDLHSPPVVSTINLGRIFSYSLIQPIFIPPVPETGNVIVCVKHAFRLEEVYDGSVYAALQAVVDPPDGMYRVDKGWLLAVSISSLYFPPVITRC
jgi:hypothetical protein